MSDYKPLGRSGMAARAAQDIPGGWHVNLGIGIPTLIADHVPAEREVLFHSENGILGMGPAPAPGPGSPAGLPQGPRPSPARAGSATSGTPRRLARCPTGRYSYLPAAGHRCRHSRAAGQSI
jgi:acyl CoA:acetate/3-ketoacid CoA transferase beta subunit